MIAPSLINQFDYWRFGERLGLHSMFIAFADESEVSTQSLPMVGVGGAIASGMQWARIARAWRKVLDTEPDVEFFHSNEFETPEGRKHSVYRDWTIDRRLSFNSKLVDVLCENQVGQLTVITVNPNDFAEVLAERNKRYASMVNAYYFCAKWVLIEHKIWMEKYFPDQKITYYFEQGGPHQTGLEHAYRESANKRGAEEYFHLTREPAFVPKETYLELQIADKMVYEATKRSSHHLDPDPPDKHSRPHPHIENHREWNIRYAADRWAKSGMQINTRWFNKKGINNSLDWWGL